MTSDDINALQLYQTYQKLINDGGIDPTHVLTASQERLIELSKRPGFTLAEFEKFIALHKKHFSGYMGEKRKQMVIKYGFDPKNASHL
ncbi:hypothetical protein LRR18_18215, partial [Mangrovimonas sp. AS39]|uniref:hypothetical protein n=1 Tax=Mangrovimonas futianensis TaxID=2895523 RepID=UPI001E2F37E4